MSATFRLGDELVELASFTDHELVFVAQRALAPGEPFDMRITLSESPIVVSGRAIGSKRRPDGRFDVRVRFTNLRKEDRERITRG